MAPKVLCLLTGAFQSDGGIASLNRLVLHTLSKTGYVITACFLGESSPKIDSRYFTEERVARISGFGGSKLKFSVAVWREVLFEKYDLVLVDHVNLASILFPLSWLGLCKYNVWLCGIEVFAPRPDFEGKLGLLGANKRIAISQYTFNRIKEQFPGLGVVVCDLAVDPVHWAEANKPSACETFDMESINGKKKTVGSRLILHVGRMASLERYKGQEVLLRSFPVIKQKYPEAQLLLAGRGDDRERLLSLARSLPSEIQCDVFMPGYVDDNTLRELYKSCFVFAMPSIGEGFGLVYLEAMAYAKPCLGGNVDATPCVIKNGVTGLLVDDPRNDVQVAECLLRFFDDPPAANEMGQAGYKLLCEYYLPGHFVERFWRALEINR